MSEPSRPTGPLTTVLFDFAGVLTSSPWGPMAAAGGGNLELLIGRRAGLHALHVDDPDEALRALDALLVAGREAEGSS